MNILLSCEFGTGQRHTWRLYELAKQFIKQGHSVTFFHYDLSFFKFVGDTPHPSLKLFAAPCNVFMLRSRHIATYGDILSYLGGADETVLRIYLNSWDNIFKATKPDLIICENAPLLCLAAGSRIPLICIGDGFSLLPFAQDRFPRLRPDVSPLLRSDILLDKINQALKHYNKSILDGFGDIWKDTFVVISHIPELDMYLPYRRDAVHAPFYDFSNVSAPVEGNEFFGYLFADYHNIETVLISLVENKMRGEILLPNATQKTKDYLEANKIKVHQGLEYPLSHYLQHKNSVIHHGGMDLTQAALFRGLPQILFPTSVNTIYIANQLKSRGCGEGLSAAKMPLKSLQDIIKIYTSQHILRQKSQLESLNMRGRFPKTAFQMVLDQASYLMNEGTQRAVLSRYQ